jgi:hypothetical protein
MLEGNHEIQWLITTGEPTLFEYRSRAAWELATKRYVKGSSVRLRKLARFDGQIAHTWDVLDEQVLRILSVPILRGDRCVVCGGRVNARGWNLGAFALHRGCSPGVVRTDLVHLLLLEVQSGEEG